MWLEENKQKEEQDLKLLLEIVLDAFSKELNPVHDNSMLKTSNR